MKRLIFTLFAICTCASLTYSQSQTQSFDANGIKVIYRPTSKKVINIRIYFRGGVTNYPANEAGIENITLNAATRCGAGKYPAHTFRDTAGAYGILMYGSSGYDSGYIQLNCITKYFDLGWDLFTAAVTDPQFDKDEVELLKTQAIAYNRSLLSVPYNRIFKSQMENAYANTPYAVDPSGDEESIAKLTAADMKNYYKTLLNKNKIFIVAVGDINKQELLEKITASFDNLPSTPYTPVSLIAPVWNDNKLVVKKEALATDYVKTLMNTPDYTDINYIPFRLGFSGLGGNLYAYLRSTRNLSYSPHTEIYQLRMPFAEMYAGSTNPREVMYAMMKVLKDIQTGGLNKEWLQHIKNNYLTSAYIEEESAVGTTNALGIGEVLGGWQYADDLTKLVQMATVEQINNALNTYIVGLRWAYLGDPEPMDGFKPPVF